MKVRHIFLSMTLATAPVTVLADSPELPTAEILGRQYYYHDVEKGESIYGIARKYDWDLEELARLNPSAATRLKKGMRLYYPTGKVTAIVRDTPLDSVPEPEPIRHTVKKGETVYSIAKKYNIPLDKIYAAHPSAKKGVKAGETLVIDQQPADAGSKYVFYEIKPGDTLLGVANLHHTSVAEILAANTGLSENNFRAGDMIRLTPNSDLLRMRTELVDEERVAKIDTYKAKKNDTWSSIARKTGVDVETLREANSTMQQPEKNELVTVPVVETIQVAQEIVSQDPRELTPGGLQEIYDSIHNVPEGRIPLEEVRVAVVMDEPSSKKDIDFLRGFLLGLDEKKDTPFKIGLKVIDGRQATSTLSSTLDDFDPEMIVATADKTFPAFLASYGEDNDVEVINVFDVKSDLYEENASMVQLLPPSALFNELAGDGLASANPGSEWVAVGGKDDNDAVFAELTQRIGSDNIPSVSYHRLNERDWKAGTTYSLYVSSQKKEEVGNVLNAVEELAADHPGSTFVVAGRPNWVTFSELFQDKYHGGDVLVPARCYLDPATPDGKGFSEKFEEAYGQPPLKSFPNYAASGYDVANYFIDLAAATGGDFNRDGQSGGKGIQSDFEIKRTSNWSGFLNPVSYILNFRPTGAIDKITVK